METSQGNLTFVLQLKPFKVDSKQNMYTSSSLKITQTQQLMTQVWANLAMGPRVFVRCLTRLKFAFLLSRKLNGMFHMFPSLVEV